MSIISFFAISSVAEIPVANNFSRDTRYDVIWSNALRNDRVRSNNRALTNLDVGANKNTPADPAVSFDYYLTPNKSLIANRFIYFREIVILIANGTKFTDSSSSSNSDSVNGNNMAPRVHRASITNNNLAIAMC
ncbi:hypothetical protein LOC71_01190 [Rhodopirellula sp. JC740]|uniref:Uncharacterized protein n=1 Tax=Rhodopirellula halodulae TaxID=2894198 RepID=A0ABS8NEH1_9BACT|nr:hypothetical protein [Rhodopirellula sp. JC740]MCC9640871.1 hypothetical protein [Rhodopirellula sp. JC740]